MAGFYLTYAKLVMTSPQKISEDRQKQLHMCQSKAQCYLGLYISSVISAA